MCELPIEIVTDILSRVPVEPLLRFRCVSKPWCYLIKSPDFIKTHLNRSIENHTNFNLILGETDLNPFNITLYSLHLDTLHIPIAFDNQFKNYNLLASCYGLLLLKGGDHDQLVLFNPSMRQHLNIPTTPIEYQPLDGSQIDSLEKYGLGYDSCNDDYKVIKTVEIRDFRKWVKIEAKVYSLKSNLWRRIQDFPYSLPNKWGTPVNGALHVLVRENYNSVSPKIIVAFDVGDEKFYLVPKPDFPNKEEVGMAVDVLGGCLCLMSCYQDYTVVWVMKVYGVKESWTKLLSISSPDVRFYVWVRPLGYSKSGDEVLLSFDRKKLIWYDLKRREIRNVEVCDLSKTLYIEVCVGNLVPIDGYGKVVNPRSNMSKRKKKQKIKKLNN